MKFFSNQKDLSVIDRISKKRIVLFKNGEFETNDPKLIERLKPRFKYESPKVLSNIANFVQLRKKAAALGINTKGMKKKDVEKALEDLKCQQHLTDVLKTVEK